MTQCIEMQTFKELYILGHRGQCLLPGGFTIPLSDLLEAAAG